MEQLVDNRIWKKYKRKCEINHWWIVESYLIDGNGVTSRLFWEFFHAMWKILFSPAGEHVRWLQPMWGEIEMNIANEHWGGTPSQPDGLFRGWFQTGAAAGAKWGGGDVGPDGSRGRMGWGQGPLSSTPSLSGIPMMKNLICYLVPHPSFLVTHPLIGVPHINEPLKWNVSLLILIQLFPIFFFLLIYSRMVPQVSNTIQEMLTLSSLNSDDQSLFSQSVLKIDEFI